MTATLDRRTARRIALAAQGFADRPHTRPTLRTIERTIKRTGVLQVDSVSVLQRAHFMPLYSRMGPYDVDLLRRASATSERTLVEYWAHVQALMPVDLWPAMGFRRAHYRDRGAKWSRQVPEQVVSDLRAVVRDRGAVTAKQIDSAAVAERNHWGWNWSQARIGLDAMYMAGELAIAGRTAQFEPLYDLAERVIPAEVLALPELSAAEGQLELVRRASRSYGVATERELADYYRMSMAETRPAVRALVEAGELEPVQVEGWPETAFLSRGAAVPRQIRAQTLISPFDPLVWERNRAHRLFDFHYRIEIYTPAAKRTYGYYVLPFLLGDSLVARVDLKADRRHSVLQVLGAFAETDAPDEAAEALSVELRRVADWLGLGGVEIVQAVRGGEFAARLRVRG